VIRRIEEGRELVHVARRSSPFGTGRRGAGRPWTMSVAICTWAVIVRLSEHSFATSPDLGFINDELRRICADYYRWIMSLKDFQKLN
jgi:hypothetical protein